MPNPLEPVPAKCEACQGPVVTVANDVKNQMCGLKYGTVDAQDIMKSKA